MVFRLFLVLVWLIPVFCRAEYTLDASPRSGAETMRGRIELSGCSLWLNVAGIGRYEIVATDDKDAPNGEALKKMVDAQVIAKVRYTGAGRVQILSTEPEPAPLSSVEWEMMRHVNRARIANNRVPFRWSPALMASARQHSANQARSGRMYHGGTSGWSGENVAVGQRDSEDVTRAWMNSAGHRANILNGRFTEIGVGAVGRYYTQQFR